MARLVRAIFVSRVLFPAGERDRDAMSHDTNYPDTQLFIDGVWRAGTGGLTIPVVNPATEATIGTVARATREDLDAALAAAEKGFEVWRATSAYERSKIMRRAAALLRERKAAIARLMTMEQGKPLAQSLGETAGAADTIEWFAEEGRRAYGRIVPARGANVSQSIIKLPVGPVAAFSPWNFPINQAVRKISAALSTGCSIIIKAPEETPASPAELVRAFMDAGVPNGVINLVFGVPAEISEYLIPHPAIQKISFTGSTAVGKSLAALAGLHMKRATMELGGHAPAIVFDDPVSSLDHLHRDKVAARLAEAGQTRQVIVFTHDMAFLLLLDEACRTTKDREATPVAYRLISRGTENAGYCHQDPPANVMPLDKVIDGMRAHLANVKIHHERGDQARWLREVTSFQDQLRTTWERAVEEAVGPVIRRLSRKVDTTGLIKLTVLTDGDCTAMRLAFGRCSALLHSQPGELNPRLPEPTAIEAEIDALEKWIADIRARQEKAA